MIKESVMKREVTCGFSKMEQYWVVQVGNEPDQMFQDKWKGRGGPIAWPARSFNLNRLDSFFGGYIKERIYLRGWLSRSCHIRFLFKLISKTIEHNDTKF